MRYHAQLHWIGALKDPSLLLPWRRRALVSDSALELTDGWVNRATRKVSLAFVPHVRIERTWLGRLLSYGHVEVAVSGLDGTDVPKLYRIEFLRDPERFVDAVCTAGRRSSLGQGDRGGPARSAQHDGRTAAWRVADSPVPSATVQREASHLPMAEVLLLLAKWPPIEMARAIERIRSGPGRSGLGAANHGVVSFRGHGIDDAVEQDGQLCETVLPWFVRHVEEAGLNRVLAVSAEVARCVAGFDESEPPGNIPVEFRSGAEMLETCRAVSGRPLSWTHPGASPTNLPNELAWFGAELSPVEIVVRCLQSVLLSNLVFRDYYDRAREMAAQGSEAGLDHCHEQMEYARLQAPIECALLVSAAINAGSDPEVIEKILQTLANSS